MQKDCRIRSQPCKGLQELNASADKKSLGNFHTIVFQDIHISMDSRRRMDNFERQCVV